MGFLSVPNLATPVGFFVRVHFPIKSESILLWVWFLSELSRPASTIMTIYPESADSGYMVIIVLAGLLNSLRNQTQSRIDSDFIGKCTRTKKPTGVARFGTERKPISFTTTEKDFHRQTAVCR